MEMKFFKCKECGKILALLKASDEPTCCGESMTQIKANTTDAAVEKHVPVAQTEGSLVKVAVGSVSHPMEEKHFIEWIAVQTKLGFQFKELTPGQEPKAIFALTDGDELVRAYAYCNLHGLWADK